MIMIELKDIKNVLASAKNEMIDHIVLFVKDICPDYPVVVDELQRDVDPPRFLLTCFNTIREERIKNAGFFYICNFDLMFDPGTKGSQELCNDVAFAIVLQLGKIPVTDTYNLRPFNIHDEYDRAQNTHHIFFDIFVTIRELDIDDIPDIRVLDKDTQVEVV